ncbi:DUF7010 family protein [Lysobacter olei]
MSTAGSGATTLAVRDALAEITLGGVGATMSGAFFWAALAGTLLLHGLSVDALAWATVLGGVVVYPVGFILNRQLGGDMLARGHPWASLIWTLGGTQLLGWVTVAVLFSQAPALVPFGLATLVGAHFLPFAWLYRSKPYAVLGVVSVVGVGVMQLLWSEAAALPISVGMTLAMLTAATVERRRLVNRRR